MSRLSRRHRASLVALALAATPLLAPAGANAALGGALTLNSTLAPDLISATVATVTPSATTVNVCFNKTIGSTPVPGNFVLGTYDNTLVAANTASANGQCAAVVFNAVLDPTTWTTLQVFGDGNGPGIDAVVNAANGLGNNSDGTGLIVPVGTGTNNGTRGRTTAPDLVGVTISGNNVSYQWDEALATNPTDPQAGNFALIRQNGTTIGTGTSSSLSTDRKTTTITFGALTPAQVQTAVRAAYNFPPAGGVASLSNGDQTLVAAAATPGGNGATDLADPIQGILVGDGTSNQIDVVFDTPTTAGAPNNYAAFLSDGQILVPTTATGTNVNTVRLTFAAGTINLQAEYVVGIGILPGATTAPASTVGMVPAGGNAGGFAAGFTTGTEALKATLDGPTNTATLTLDQRYANAAAPGFRRVDNTGSVNTTDTATLSFGSTATPGQTTIQAKFGSLSGTRGIQMLLGATQTSLAVAGLNAFSMSQILGPVSSNAG